MSNAVPVAKRMEGKHVKRLLPRPGMKTGCWEWTGFCDRKGYAKIWNPGGNQYAHVVMYQLRVGPVPAGWEVDHLCNNTSCVRPTHLEAVTGAENTRRRDERLGNPSARKDHCKNGHPFSGDNLFINTKGHRVCRACSRAKANRYNSRKRATS